MASYIHAGIPSSHRANPPETPPTIHPSPLGNLIPLRYLLSLLSFFAFLNPLSLWRNIRALILSILRRVLNVNVSIQPLITVAAQGES